MDESSECRTKVVGPGLITMGSMDELYWTDGVLRMLHVRRVLERGGAELIWIEQALEVGGAQVSRKACVSTRWRRVVDLDGAGNSSR